MSSAALGLCLALWVFAPDAIAQSSGTAEQKSQDSLKLSPFTVVGDQVGPYQAAEATSGGRVRINPFVATQSLHVVTSNLMEDLGANSPLESLKYFAGVTGSTLPPGSPFERLGLRGYEVRGYLFDGFPDGSPSNIGMNQTSALIDRMEVALGTDSIMSPAGIPGGTVNVITKKPRFANFGRIKVQLAKYDSTQASLDLNRVASKHLALRSITSGGDSDNYQYSYQRAFNHMSAASWQFANGGVLLAQFRYSRTTTSIPQGLPIDPAIGTHGYARLLPGLTGEDMERVYATSDLALQIQSYNLSYVGRLSDQVSTRLVARVKREGRQSGQTTMGISGPTGGAIDPRTGEWTPGFSYGPGPSFTRTPAAQPNGIFNVTNGVQRYPYDWAYTLGNDYAFELARGDFTSELTAGFAASAYRGTRSETYLWPQVSFNMFTAPIPLAPAVPPMLSAASRTRSESLNLYVNEVAKLFQGRVVASAGLVKVWHKLETTTSAYPSGPFSSTPAPLLINYGLVFKVRPSVSVYHGHSESTQPSNPLPTQRTAPGLDETAAQQDEVGVRIQFLNGRATASLAYYRIDQDNFPIFNPLNNVSPAPVPPLPNLYLNRVAQGWEFQTNATLTSELSTIISYTTFTNRDPNNIPVRGTAEQSGAAWFHYEGRQGRFQGLGLGIGYAYRGKVAGDTATGFTAASTPTHPIPNQPSFYVAPVGLVNLTASYKWGKPWTVRAFVDNALDKDYIAAALARTFGIFPGVPRNLRLLVEYSF